MHTPPACPIHPRSAIDGLTSGGTTVARRGGGDYSVPGVHVNQDALAALTAKRAMDRTRLSATERLLQNTQDMVKQSEAKKGEGRSGAA